MDYQFQLYWNWELHICVRYYKHAMQTWFSRTVKKGYDIMSRLVMTAIMRLLIFVTLYGKTYTNDFPFSNGFPFTSRLCQLFEWLGHPFTRNSLFEWLPHPLVRNINPFEQLCYAFDRNIKPFKRLGHPFVEDIRPFKWLGNLYYGIPLNFVSNDMHGRRVTLLVQKNSLVRAVI